jgi:hypothetical protein
MTKAFKLSISCNSDDNYSVDWIECETFIIEDSESKILNISKDEYIPTKGDKFYFLPGVSIPRVKLKDLTKDYGIKSTRNLKDATYVFAGRSTENKVSDRLWSYKIPTDKVQMLYDHLKENNFDGYYLEKLETALAYNEHEFVYLDYGSAGLFRNNTSELFEKIREEENVKNLLRNSNYISTIDADYVEDILDIEKFQIPILDESALLKHINGEDATTIDEEVYEQLKTMFNSSDADNHVLAMEIMANSNYIDSLLYIEMLFKQYSYTMERCRSKNHVNFKGLLAFLGKDKSSMSTSTDDIVNCLRANDVLTADRLTYLLDKFHNEIQDHGDSEIFLVKTITVKEDVLKEIDHNFKYQVINDYISENDNELFDENAKYYSLQHENCEDQDVEEIVENSINEDTVDSLNANEDIEEETEVNNIPGETLETNKNNNEGGFDWF